MSRAAKDRTTVARAVISGQATVRRSSRSCCRSVRFSGRVSSSRRLGVAARAYRLTVFIARPRRHEQSSSPPLGDRTRNRRRNRRRGGDTALQNPASSGTGRVQMFFAQSLPACSTVAKHGRTNYKPPASIITSSIASRFPLEPGRNPCEGSPSILVLLQWHQGCERGRADINRDNSAASTDFQSGEQDQAPVGADLTRTVLTHQGLQEDGTLGNLLAERLGVDADRRIRIYTPIPYSLFGVRPSGDNHR